MPSWELDRAEQPAAAVEVDDERPAISPARRRRAGTSAPESRAPSTAIDVVGDGGHGFAGSEAGEQRLEVDARLRDGQQMGVRAPGRGDLVEQLPGDGVERHGGNLRAWVTRARCDFARALLRQSG